MKVCCVFSLELPRRGDSSEYTQYTIFDISKEIHPKLSLIFSYENFSKGLKSEFETAVVNEPSGFESMKFYCIECAFMFCSRLLIGTECSHYLYFCYFYN